MTVRTNNPMMICCAAIAIVLASGCGEMTDSPVANNLITGEDTAAQAQQPYNYDIDLPDLDDGLTIDYVVDVPSDGLDLAAIENAADWPELVVNDPLDDGFAHGIQPNNEEDVIDEENEEDVEEEADFSGPEANGFGDGSAVIGEWKHLAIETCSEEDGELSDLVPVLSNDEGAYRGARFACSYEDVSLNQEIVSEYTAVIFGGESSCKTYDVYKQQIQNLCGTEAEIIEKKVFDRCSGDNEEPMYRSALFICHKADF